MQRMQALDRLRDNGRITWAPGEQGWRGSPAELLRALSQEGFEECKHEVAATRRDRTPCGGMWQGLNSRTGAVVSAIWVHRAPSEPAILFVEVDGEPVRDALEGGGA